ncbi:MAG: metallophosphoesterase [Clostridia bacterium]|nr:metallophosphoesterase [Clostridia bacterium]
MKETLYRLGADIAAPINAALLTDLHDRPFDSILASLEQNEPDLILIAGDLIVGRPPLDEDSLKMAEAKHALSFLRACARQADTFVSLGNHEWMLCEEDLALIRQTGAVLLDDEWQPWRGLAIGGLTPERVRHYRAFRAEQRTPGTGACRYPQGDWGRPDTDHRRSAQDFLDRFEQAPGYKLLLCHHPEYWTQKNPPLRDRRIDLTVSGHAHGGQWRFYWRGFWRGVFAPGQGLFPQYTEGLHEGPMGRLIVSRGLSNTCAPIPRFMNPREIVYIRLEP